MDTYRPLQKYLESLPPDRSDVSLSFAKVEELIGCALPSSARRYAAWWNNERQGRHVQARSWVDAGWTASADLVAEVVRFSRAHQTV